MEKLLFKFRFIFYGAVIGSILSKGIQLLVPKENSLLFSSLYAVLALGTVPIIFKLDKKFINNN